MAADALAGKELPMNAFVHVFPGEEFTLQRRMSNASGVALADASFAVIERASSLLEPMVLEIACGCYSISDHGFAIQHRPRRGGYLAVRNDLPEDIAVTVRPTYAATERLAVSRIDRDLLAEILGRIERDSCEEDGLLAAWESMFVNATAARIFPDDTNLDRVLNLEDDRRRHVQAMPIDWRGDEPWVIGPRYGILSPPFRLHVTRGFGGLRLGIDVCWSPWTQPGSEGRRAVDAYLMALASLGCELEDVP